MTRASAVLVAVVVVAAACAAPPPGEMDELRTAHVVVPAVPLPRPASMRPDPALLEAAACAECSRTGGPDPDRFFSGRLALDSLDALVTAPGSDDRAAHAGNLLLSGYFGGIQLRGSLGAIGARDAGPAAPLLELVGRSTLAGLDEQVARLQELAATGSDAQVRRASSEMMPVLALLYGYNLGYLEVALEHPPPGAPAPIGALECPTTLSCRAPELQLGAAGRFDATFARLDAPQGGDWIATSALAHTLVGAAVPGGRAVWSELLGGDGFDPDGYAAIVDLSGGFLQVAGVALAGAAEATAHGDVALARAALALTAGLVAWAGSYFLGLASPLPDTARPELACAGTG